MQLFEQINQVLIEFDLHGSHDGLGSSYILACRLLLESESLIS